MTNPLGVNGSHRYNLTRASWRLAPEAARSHFVGGRRNVPTRPFGLVDPPLPWGRSRYTADVY